MGAQSWGQRLLTPGPLLARFVPNCANWSVGSAHWAQPTAQRVLRTRPLAPIPFGSAQFSPTSLCPPNLAKPTALCTVASNRLGQTSACHALLSVQFPTHSPNSKDHFAIPNPSPLHSCPYAGGGHSIEPTAQVGLISEHRPEGGGALGLPTAPSPLHKSRAERGRTGGWDARGACGPAERPRCGHAL